MLALGAVVLLLTTTTTTFAKHANEQYYRYESEGQIIQNKSPTQESQQQKQPQQPQPQEYHEQIDMNSEFDLNEDNHYISLDVNGGNLHKMIGVDYKPEGTAHIDYTNADPAQADFSIHEMESESDAQAMNEETIQKADSCKCLIFSDEFNKLDNSIWRHDITLTGGGNYEVQAYLNNRTNTFVRDGIFYIRPTLTEYRIGARALREGGVLDFWGSDPGTQCTGNYDYGCFRVAGAGGNILNPIQSGLVRTVESFKFRYGKVEVRAKMPKGKWIWPAIWMLPAHYQYGSWPASGEIDIVESRGNGPEYPGGGYDKMASTLHWGPSYEFNRYEMTHAEYTLPPGRTFADDFHVFTLDWTPQGIKTYVDGNILLDVPFDNMFEKGQFPPWIDNLWANSNAAPFDQEFYLIMNVAVAGTAGYFPDGVGGKPWSDKSEHAVNEFYAAKDDWYPTWGPEDGLDRAMAVDYVRVYRNDC
ncbi:hypothetical protein FBU30_005111 [Linnemannia zychae]|nr:hypothetical protein FBU30_005111 [Linnemannia zychae]